MEFARTAGERKSLNLTPLIDIIFLLVVFFMLSSTFVAQEALELDFSPVEGEAEAGKSDTLYITATPDDDIIKINGKPYERAEFSKVMRRAMVDKPNRPVVLVSENGVNVQNMINVMDLITLVGGRNVTLAE